jgi:predicted nucleotidyltransferase
MATLPFDTSKLVEICRNVDLLVYFSKPKSLLTLVALERQISTALGRKVDLLTEAAISPYLRERIKRELQVIYETR